jgi:glutathione S-transferase
MTMTLYYSPGACSMSPHIVALEAGIPLKLSKVDLKAKKTQDGGDFLAVNPKGYVPALEIEPGKVLTEGPAIVQYLADLKPELGLAPRNGTFERYKLQEALNFVTSELHKGFSPLFNPALAPEFRQMVVDRLNLRFKALDVMLAASPYLTGANFTVADAYLFTVLNWARPAKVDLSAFPHVQAYHAKIAERPSAQAAMKEEGLIH